MFFSKLINLFLLIFILINNSFAKWAFLSDQSKCNLNCLNGGVCSFLVKKPEVHKCICLIGMFEGPQCEQQIDQNIILTTTKISSLNNEEEFEENGEEEELIYEDENKEKENNPAVFGQTQHFIGLETNTMSSNLEKFGKNLFKK
uniref:EGF-like domain-containing protein n=1 Tax=Meloidogyne hapla TaxID=6305 RepID=A0A1I8B1V2_MELHA